MLARTFTRIELSKSVTSSALHNNNYTDHVAIVTQKTTVLILDAQSYSK